MDADILKVSSKSVPASVAGAIAGYIQEEGFVEYYFCPACLGEDGSLTVEFQYVTKCDIEGDTRITVEGRCKDSTFRFDIPMIFPLGNKKKLKIEKPYLWWPRGYGEQNMYDITLTLTRDGEVVDRVEFVQGLRTVTLDFTQSLEDEQKGEFVLIVNNNSSASGWAILLIRPSSNVSLNSCTIFAMVIPSKAMSTNPFKVNKQSIP